MHVSTNPRHSVLVGETIPALADEEEQLTGIEGNGEGHIGLAHRCWPQEALLLPQALGDFPPPTGVQGFPRRGGVRAYGLDWDRLLGLWAGLDEKARTLHPGDGGESPPPPP